MPPAPSNPAAGAVVGAAVDGAALGASDEVLGTGAAAIGAGAGFFAFP